MTERGEANMMIEKRAAATPQKNFLVLPCKARRETKAIAENTVIIRAKSPITFALSFFGAYMRKITIYVNSIAPPAPLRNNMRRLCRDTNGRLYLLSQLVMHK